MAAARKQQPKAQNAGKYISLSLLVLTIIAFIWSFSVAFLQEIATTPSQSLLTTATIVNDVSLSFLFPMAVLAWMYFKGMHFREIISSLGLSRKSLSMKMIAFGIIIFLVIFIMEAAVSLISSSTGVAINTNANLLFVNAPLWFYVFISIIAPINEEVFFRGFLVPRIGILLSAAVFAILHAGYGSSFGIEIIAAFIFGIIAGYARKKLKSLYPSILAHILVDSLTAAVILFCPTGAC